MDMTWPTSTFHWRQKSCKRNRDVNRTWAGREYLKHGEKYWSEQITSPCGILSELIPGSEQQNVNWSFPSLRFRTKHFAITSPDGFVVPHPRTRQRQGDVCLLNLLRNNSRTMERLLMFTHFIVLPCVCQALVKGMTDG